LSLNSSPDHHFTTVLIIPTGIGAAMGGFAGDAIPIVRALAQVSDRVITHPNVLNGAQLYWPLPNTLYVEGYGLDQFAAGHWGLAPTRQNRIGLIIDQGIEPDLRVRQLQAAEACRATLGLCLTDYVITDAPLGVTLKTAASGATWGTIQQPDSLLRSAERLIQDAKAEAIAVVARFPEDLGSEALENYRHGQGVDPLAGAEAIISHLIVRQFQIPCAHSPALAPLPLDPHLSPRAAAEEIGYTFLPSVLVGLSRAPQYIQGIQDIQTPSSAPRKPHQIGRQLIWRQDVNALIIPATACGGNAILEFSQTAAQIITVAENQTTLQVTANHLGLDTLSVNTYLEAIGVVAALKAGVTPDVLQPNVPHLKALPSDKFSPYFSP
jgi:Protein of unknown function (DUF3326)